MHVATEVPICKRHDTLLKCNKGKNRIKPDMHDKIFRKKKERYILKINQKQRYIENKVGNVGNGAGTGGAES